MKSASVIFLALMLSAQNAVAQSADGTAPTVAAPPADGMARPGYIDKSASKLGSSPSTPSETQVAAGSNIGLVTYPLLQCIKPQFDVQAPKKVQNFNPNVGIKGPITAVNDDSYNEQLKTYNDAAKAYNAQTAAYKSCAQTYSANANADTLRIHSKLEAVVSGSAATSPSGAQAVAGSNIGLTDYPAATCVKPNSMDADKLPGPVPPLDAKMPEINAYNLRVTQYNKYNAEVADYNSCIKTYADNANADIRRIKMAVDAAKTTGTRSNDTESPPKNFGDSYGAPGLQIDKMP